MSQKDPSLQKQCQLQPPLCQNSCVPLTHLTKDTDRRHGSDLSLLWLWCRQAATAPIRPLAWEPPYAMGAALEKAKDKKKKKF